MTARRSAGKKGASPSELAITRYPRAAWATDVGRVRTHNEDALLVLNASQEGEQALPPFGLFILADGMGGQRSGEIASTLATRTAAAHILQHLYLDALISPELSAAQPSVSEVLEEAFNQANTAVSTMVPGAGTTLTCVLTIGRRAYVAHVGDSRVYLLSTGGAEQLTHDHSLVDRLVELGQLTADEAASHPQRNILYRAVGQTGRIEVDINLHTTSPGDRILVCSDGLWGLVSDQEIVRMVSTSSSLQEACEMLVEAANLAGGQDNISVILIEPPGI